MKKVNCRGLKKLSDGIKSEAPDNLEKKVKDLQHLISTSTEISAEISGVITRIHKVPASGEDPYTFTSDLTDNEKLLTSVLRDCDDVVYRSFKSSETKFMMVYISGMVDTAALEKSVISPLMSASQQGRVQWDKLIETTVAASSVSILASAGVAVEYLLKGSAVILAEGEPTALVINAPQYEKRKASEPSGEDVIRGPHEGFNETIEDSIVLVRRRARDTNLKVRLLLVGERTKTSVAVLYIENLVKPGLVEEVLNRINKIKVDKILSAGALEEQIVDQPWSPFNQTHPTERPDKVLAALYEGRAAIIIDGTPIALIVPVTYMTLMQSPEDYNTQSVVASLVGLTRHISVLIAIYLPAIYISVVSYQSGVLPTNLAVSIAELRAKTPFPALLEAFFMEALLEIFQEAITRLPTKVAGAAGVVGALVIGTTVVEAGLVNALLVVVIATTAIASYTMPSYNMTHGLRILRVPLMLAASVFGLYGFMLGAIAVLIHMCSLRSFGESFMGGFLDITLIEDWKGGILRFPWSKMSSRPKEFGAQERTRQQPEEG